MEGPEYSEKVIAEIVAMQRNNAMNDAANAHAAVVVLRQENEELKKEVSRLKCLIETTGSTDND